VGSLASRTLRLAAILEPLSGVFRQLLHAQPLHVRPAGNVLTSGSAAAAHLQLDTSAAERLLVVQCSGSVNEQRRTQVLQSIAHVSSRHADRFTK
jgi:hypothetical protein